MKILSLSALNLIPQLKRISLCLILFLGAGAAVRAQQQAYESPAGTKFWLYTPPGYNTSSSSFPLLLSLHSKGEVGDDLTKLTSNNREQMPSRLIYLNRWRQDLPFIVLTPQLKPTAADPDPQWPAGYIDEVVRYVIANFRVDVSRIYLTGISRGGTGSWTYASAYPHKIAAMVPMSGRSDVTQACAIKDIPVWAFHGDGDDTAPPQYSIDMVNAIKACSPSDKYSPRLNLLNAKDHNGWNEVYNGTNGYRIYEWLLQFKKGDFGNKPPYVNAGPDHKIHLRSGVYYLIGDYFDSDGSIANVVWTQTSGNALTLSNADTKFLKLTNLQTGIFEFELSVTDNSGATKRDRITLEIVNTAASPSITSLVVVNGKTNSDIGILGEDYVLDKKALGITEINIRALVSADALSVRFNVNADQNTRTLNTASPLYIKPQTTGAEWEVGVGEYLVCATPFTKSNATGIKGVTQCYKITVTERSQSCAGTGRITREVWNNIAGNTVSSIPVTSPPNSVTELSTFEAPFNIGNNYATRISGYVCPPVTGNYTFFIASDDHSELWLSTDQTPANKVKIASVKAYTARGQWDKYASQKSTPIFLRANAKYYIEALHKEATGGDHIAVGWQLPDNTLERPIPGNRLMLKSQVINTPPVVDMVRPAHGASFSVSSSIKMVAEATDSDGAVTKVEFFRNGTKLGEDISPPYEYIWHNVPAGTYTLSSRAYDNNGATAASQNVTVHITESCNGLGYITRDYWSGVSGVHVASIPVNTPPASTSTLTLFEGPSNVGTHYASRIRGYVCVPITGNYTFWISSDDHSELWLGSDEDPMNKVKIASVTGHTAIRQWDKYSSQKSAWISLTAGRNYYIEALHKEGTGVDHVAVGWQLPDGSLERPIPANRLSPYTSFSAAYSTDFAINKAIREESSDDVMLSPNPATNKTFNIIFKNNTGAGEQEASITITSMTGLTVYRNKISYSNGAITVKLDDNVPPGVYFVMTKLSIGRLYIEKIVLH